VPKRRPQRPRHGSGAASRGACRSRRLAIGCHRAGHLGVTSSANTRRYPWGQARASVSATVAVTRMVDRLKRLRYVRRQVDTADAAA
jgi:hypothetical protein